MSWSLTQPEIKNVPAPKARQLVSMQNAPSPILDYVRMGIDGLIAYHKDPEVLITVTGHGHVCGGPGSYEITTATAEVKRGEAAPEERK